MTTSICHCGLDPQSSGGVALKKAWIPDQVRDDNCGVRDDNCGARDDNWGGHILPSACTFQASQSLRKGVRLMRWCSTWNFSCSISVSKVR